MSNKPSMPGEIWLPIPGLDGTHEVSSAGRVWSVRRRVTNNRSVGGCMMSQRDKRGYPTVYIGAKARNVHRLVLGAFVGPLPAGLQSCHNDGDRYNNRIENLRYDTAKNNQRDRAKHGTAYRGETHRSAKFTEAEVWAVCARLDKGEQQTSIAKHYGVDKQAIHSIHKGKSWAWLTGRGL